MSESIEQRARFDHVRYANVWEDADVLCDALQPAPGRRVLSIASAGDNAFALAAEGAHVVAVDLSPAQLALVELKRAAVLGLDHDALLRFLGVRHDADRLVTYRRLAPALPEPTRAFWDDRLDEIHRGVVHTGKFERYFELFRRRVVPFFHSRRTVDRLLAEKSLEERERFYAEEWDTWRWRALFRLFFSRRVMGRMGRDPEFFRYVQGDVAARILQRARHAFTALPTHDNPYLRFIFTGTFGETLPRYLEPGRFGALRAGMARLEIVAGAVDAIARERGPFDGYNLSDVFEYVNAPLAGRMYEELIRSARPGARLAYWNMLVPRRRPEKLADRVRSLDAIAGALHARDRAFFYSAFVLEEVA